MKPDKKKAILKKKRKKKAIMKSRSAKTGRYVSKKFAKKHKATTVREKG